MNATERTPRAHYRKHQQQHAYRAFGAATVTSSSSSSSDYRPRTAPHGDGGERLSKEADHAWRALGLLPPAPPPLKTTKSSTSLHRLAREKEREKEKQPAERHQYPAFRRKPLPDPSVPRTAQLPRSTSSTLTIRPPPPPRTSSKTQYTELAQPPPLPHDADLKTQYHQSLQRQQQKQHQRHHDTCTPEPRTPQHHHSHSDLTDDSGYTSTWDKHWSNSSSATDYSTTEAPGVHCSPATSIPSYYTRSQLTPAMPSEPHFAPRTVSQVDSCLYSLDFPSVASESRESLDVPVMQQSSCFESDSEDEEDGGWHKTMERVRERLKLKGKSKKNLRG